MENDNTGLQLTEYYGTPDERCDYSRDLLEAAVQLAGQVRLSRWHDKPLSAAGEAALTKLAELAGQVICGDLKLCCEKAERKLVFHIDAGGDEPRLELNQGISVIADLTSRTDVSSFFTASIPGCWAGKRPLRVRSASGNSSMAPRAR